MEMTEEQIAEIEARAASVYPEDAGWSGYEAEDALPVVRDDVPALVAEVRRMRAELAAFKGALSRANELRIGDRAEARLDERWACSEFAEKWLREVGEITQDTPADLADAIRARGAGGGA